MVDRELMPREIVERELEDCRWRFDQGDYNFLIHAFRLCTFNDLPLPEWVAQAVEAGLHYAKKHGGAEGQGKAGGHSVKTKNLRIMQMRHKAADTELARTKKKGEAYEQASIRLRGTIAQGEAREIGKAYLSFERVLATVYAA